MNKSKAERAARTVTRVEVRRRAEELDLLEMGAWLESPGGRVWTVTWDGERWGLVPTGEDATDARPAGSTLTFGSREDARRYLATHRLRRLPPGTEVVLTVGGEGGR